MQLTRNTLQPQERAAGGHAHYTYNSPRGDVYVSRSDGPLVTPRGGPTMRVAIVRDGALLGRQVLVPHPPQPSPRVRGDGAPRPIHDLQKFGTMALQ